MTPNELAKYGLRVKPLNIDDTDAVWRIGLNSQHQANICDCLEPIALADADLIADDQSLFDEELLEPIVSPAPIDDDTPCTDCGDMGITHQTETFCTCTAGAYMRLAARQAAPPDVAQAARVLLDHCDKPDCVEAVSRDFIDTLHGMITLHSRTADGGAE